MNFPVSKLLPNLAMILPFYYLKFLRALPGKRLDLLNQAPGKFEILGIGAQNWNQRLMKMYLAQQLKLSQSAVFTILKKIGINWQRAKLTVTSPDPLDTVKHQRPDALKQKVKQGDSATHSPPADLPGYNNPCYALFNRLLFPSGKGLYPIHQRKRHQKITAHLTSPIDTAPDTFRFVLFDNASTHTTQDIGQLNKRIERG
jgi:hypothetical protein